MSDRAGQQGSASVEVAGLAAAVVALLVTLGPALPMFGDGLGSRVGAVVQDLADGRPVRWAKSASFGHRHTMGDAPPENVRPRTSPAARANAADRFSWWSRSGQRTWAGEPGRAQAAADACVLCGIWSAHGTPRGAEAGVHLSLVHAEVAARSQGRLPSAGTIEWAGSASAALGADARARAEAGVTSEGLRIDGSAEARIGAVARAEHELAAELAGVAVRHAAAAEAWAGAGAAASGYVQLDREQVGVGGRIGAALGVGGAVETHISADPAALAKLPWLRILNAFVNSSGAATLALAGHLDRNAAQTPHRQGDTR